jgi:hypothetical protein
VALLVRIATEADRPSVLELFERAFRAAADPAEWAWKYDGNPNRADSIVAVDGTSVVGFFGGLGTLYRGAEGALPGVAATDVMTDRRARTLGRRPLFATLFEVFCSACASRGIPFVFGFPNERARLAGEKTNGYQPVEPAAQWARPLPAPHLIGRLRRRLLRIRAGEAFSRPHDALAETLHARAGWRTDRSSRVLNWRFFARPNAEYRSLQLLDLGGRSLGYAVVRVVIDRALLVDLQVRDEESGTIADLIQAVSDSLAGTPATRLEFRAPSRSRTARRLAGELGFSPIPTDTYFEVRPFDAGFDIAKASRAFDYRFVDHEIF